MMAVKDISSVFGSLQKMCRPFLPRTLQVTFGEPLLIADEDVCSEPLTIQRVKTRTIKMLASKRFF